MSSFKLFTHFLLFIFVISMIFVINNFSKIQKGLSYPYNTAITNTDWYTPKSVVKGKAVPAYELSDNHDIAEEILEEISEYAQKNNSSSFLVMHKGELLVENYWKEANVNSTTNSMSMVKTIISLLIGKAIEEGKIKSEKDLVADYIPEWRNDRRSNITIEDLLLMQSGLRKDNNNDGFFTDQVNLYIGSEVVATALDIPAEDPPATTFEYNNANTQILAILLENAPGQSIEEYTSQKLWQPLGASNAGWWLDRTDGMPKVFCCFFATAQDWLRLGKLILQKGNWDGEQLIAKSWVNKMLLQSSLEQNYGYHIWLFNEDAQKAPFAQTTYVMKGQGNQYVYIVPNLELVIVRVGEEPLEWDESLIVNCLSDVIPSNDKYKEAVNAL